MGIQTPNKRYRKFGGPVIGDVDNDGYEDLILIHHNQYPDIYYNDGKGGFTQSKNFPKTSFKKDFHGAAIAPISPNTRNRHVVITTGGSKGSSFSSPHILLTGPKRTFENISNEIGATKFVGRNRGAMYINLDRDTLPYPDLVTTNFRPKIPGPQLVYFIRHDKGGYFNRSAGPYAFSEARNTYAVDVDGDGFMEVFAYSPLSVYKLGAVAPFDVVDITNDVLPAELFKQRRRFGVHAVAEIDFDNDGDFDVLIVRSRSLYQRRLMGPDMHFRDILLENRNGKYIDVSEKAGLNAVDSRTVSVTTGDFNNDGFMDALLTQYDRPDAVLLGRGDGTFQRVEGLVQRNKKTTGDHAVAVDYDQDGWLDVVSGQGDRFKPSVGGTYRILKNVLSNSLDNRWLLVTVRNAADASATALHAVVTVTTGSVTFSRRVGSPGSSSSSSFLETVHFGCGGFATIDSVRVRWVSGVEETVSNVPSNTHVYFGKL